MLLPKPALQLGKVHPLGLGNALWRIQRVATGREIAYVVYFSWLQFMPVALFLWWPGNLRRLPSLLSYGLRDRQFDTFNKTENANHQE